MDRPSINNLQTRQSKQRPHGTPHRRHHQRNHHQSRTKRKRQRIQILLPPTRAHQKNSQRSFNNTKHIHSHGPYRSHGGERKQGKQP